MRQVRRPCSLIVTGIPHSGAELERDRTGVDDQPIEVLGRYVIAALPDQLAPQDAGDHHPELGVQGEHRGPVPGRQPGHDDHQPLVLCLFHTPDDDGRV